MWKLKQRLCFEVFEEERVAHLMHGETDTECGIYNFSDYKSKRQQCSAT